MSMITVNSPTGKTITTDLCENIQQILADDGIPWFEALRKPITVSEKAFGEIDNLISISL